MIALRFNGGCIMTDHVQVQKLRPILVVQTMADCLEFWGRIGFSPIITVPDAPPFGFAILARDGIELMLQTAESVGEDLSGAADRISAAILYVSLPVLDPVIEALAGAPVAVPRRKTAYGADEIFVNDPAGNLIGFAAPAA
jgi:hypothetical protein